MVGSIDDVGAALTRRGFRRVPDADPSVSLFGRAAGLVLRKHAQAGTSANLLRLWRAPIAYRGQSVLVAQAGRPVGGRFAEDERRAKLHPDVDEVRNILVQDLIYSGGLAQLAFATGVGAVPPSQPRELPGDEHYYTDGLRGVLLFSTRPMTLPDVKLLDWEPMSRSTASPTEAKRAPR
jgi:hypothetical protein